MYTPVYKEPISPQPRASGERNAERSRQAILFAAKQLFATRGYGATGIRDVALLAGVNSALVNRYFGAKIDLFRAALDDIIEMTLLLAGNRSRFGERIARIFIASHGVPNPMAMMVMATADAEAREASIEVLRRKVIGPLTAWLGESTADEKALRLNMLWVGFFAGWQLLPLADFTDERLTAVSYWLARATQAIVDEDEAPTSYASGLTARDETLYDIDAAFASCPTGVTVLTNESQSPVES